MEREEPLHAEPSGARRLERTRVQIVDADSGNPLRGVEPAIGERGIQLDERDEDVSPPEIAGDLGGVGVLRDRQREVREPDDGAGNRRSRDLGPPHAGFPPRMDLDGHAVSREPHHRAAPSRATPATTTPAA